MNSKNKKGGESPHIKFLKELRIKCLEQEQYNYDMVDSYGGDYHWSEYSPLDAENAVLRETARKITDHLIENDLSLD